MGTNLNPVEYDLYKRCQVIKDRIPNGVPLNKADRTTVLTALRRHPNAKAKFGSGVQAVVVDKFILGSRCFFVIRADGTAEDFSLANCFYPKRFRSVKALDAMDRWNYRPMVQRFHKFMAARRFKRQVLQPHKNSDTGAKAVMPSLSSS